MFVINSQGLERRLAIDVVDSPMGGMRVNGIENSFRDEQEWHGVV